MKCYVLNTSLKPLPIGAIGELYIGGAGLARGYLNRSELTAERFITNPFQSIEERRENRNSRLYRTGDLVRWLPDGNLEYIGRNDFQVKIRGYRIELSEIESVLSSYEGVKQSAVIARKHKTEGELVSKYLVGYYVADIKLDEDNILNYLQSKLPEYMLPSILVHLEELPLTINGKLDRKVLPDPELTSSIGYVEPRNEMEAKVCSIWAEVLGLDEDKVGILDDFFKLGGDSILAIKLASKLNNSYQSYLKIADIFIYRSIEQLLPRIIQTKDSYQTIIKLNNSVEKPNLFMIHPASVGCEIYTSLANRLVNSFSCYGVDSYNLYNKDKITDLNELAKYYLSHIDEVMLKTHQKEYHLLGWSLGGQIVLEIASILEQKGYPKIKLYLLDTILYDPYLLAINNSVGIDTEEKQKEYRDALSIKGWDQSYIERIILNMDIEDKLIKQKITSILTNTYILLFKTMLEDTRVKIDNNNSNINLKEVHEYLLNLQYNNIDTIVKNKSSIKVKKAHNAHHGNILDQEEDFLAFEIGSALKYL